MSDSSNIEPASDLSNAAVAERFDALAGLLDLAGASPYSTRAYRRAAELARSLEAPLADLVRSGRVRELRGIGPGIEARLRELVETGRIAELEELEREVSPALVGVGRLIGIGPQRMVEIGRTLGIRTPTSCGRPPEPAGSRRCPGSARRRRPGSARRSSGLLPLVRRARSS